MRRLIRIVVAGISFLLGQAAFAADCPDITGEWGFDLQCVGIAPTGELLLDDSYLITGYVDDQSDCVFAGTLKGLDWVGALHGKKKKDVLADFGHATVVGKLAGRSNGYDRMSISYVFPGDAGGVETTQTACTGEGVRVE